MAGFLYSNELIYSVRINNRKINDMRGNILLWCNFSKIKKNLKFKVEVPQNGT